MDVVILAGGLGTRLRSVVSDVPKCMAMVDNKPFVEYWLRYLSNTNAENVVFSLGYKAEVVTNWIETIEKHFPFNINYVVEQEPLGTGGAIRFAIEKTKSEDVLIINGDSFFKVPINKFYSQYKTKNCPLALALKPMTNFERYGNVKIDSYNKIISFGEKEFCEQGLINGGVYFLNKRLLDLRSLPAKFSFEKEVLEKRSDIFGFVYDEYFIDIGIPEDFYKAQKELPLQFE